MLNALLAMTGTVYEDLLRSQGHKMIARKKAAFPNPVKNELLRISLNLKAVFSFFNSPTVRSRADMSFGVSRSTILAPYMLIE